MDSMNIVDHFGDLLDSSEDNRLHLMRDIVMVIVCASICGAEKWDNLGAFGHTKEEWLRRFLKLRHGIPSHDTIARMFSRIDLQALNERFVSSVCALNTKYERQEVKIDGKTLRRSHDGANCVGLTLGQVKVAEKSNVITAIPELLKMLELSGCLVTIDAMGPSDLARGARTVQGSVEHLCGKVAADQHALPGLHLQSSCRRRTTCSSGQSALGHRELATLGPPRCLR